MNDEVKEVQFNLGGSDIERLVLSGGDLQYLIDLPQTRLLTHTEVRLAAGILRRLLIDGQLTALWKPIGQLERVLPTVTATEIDTALSKWPSQWIRYAWAGGASTAVAHHTSMILAAVPKGEHERYGSPEAFVQSVPLPITGGEKRMTVDQWLASTKVAIQTNEIGLIRISRRSVLKYVANRKGGVHFDPKRDLTAASQKKRRNEVEHYLLDHGLLRVGHLSGPEYEVASMVQAVAKADWARQFVEWAQTAAPEDFFGDPYELKFWTGLHEADGSGWATSRMEPGPTPTPELQES